MLPIVYGAPLLLSGDDFGIGDWDIFLFWHAAALRSMFEYGQLPIWNPWYCGGWVMLQNAQIPLLSPVYLLGSLVSVPLAMKIGIVLHFAVGLAGMLLIARYVYGIRSALLALAPAALFVFNGYFALQITEGHVWVLAFAYIPYVFLGFELYLRRGRPEWLVLAGAALALAIVQGGVYPAPLAALMLGFHALLRAALDRDPRPLAALAGTAGYTLCFSAPKLLPVVELLRRFPRALEDSARVPFSAWPEVFLERGQLRSLYQRFDGQAFGWHEYGAYIGVALAFMVCAALVWSVVSYRRGARSRHRLVLAVLFVILLLLYAGSFHALAPYALLRELPVFGSLRISSRFLIPLLFVAALLLLSMTREVATGVERTRAGRRRRWAAPALALLSIVVTADLVESNRRTFALAFPIPAAIFDGLPEPFEYGYIERVPSYGAYSALYPALLMNLSVVDCYDPHGHPRGVDPEKPLVHSPREDATIAAVEFSPSRVRFSLRAVGPTPIVLNQNFADGWRLEGVEADVESVDDVPVAVVPAGDYESLAFVFRPPGLVVGCVLFVAGVLAATVHVRLARRAA